MCVSLTDDGRRQAKLPVKHGGLGVLSDSDIALPAYLAFVFGSAELSLQLLPSSLTQFGGTNDVKYNHYVDIIMAVDHHVTNTRCIDCCQSENMESPSAGYRR